MKQKLFSFGCCLVMLLTTIFTSCKQEVPVPEMVTISYVSEYGTLAKTEKIVEKGYKLKADDLPTLKQEGYTFDKWYINKVEAKVDTVINKDTVLFANWTNDLIPPKDVTELNATNLDGTVALSWKDPTDKDLFGIEITYIPKATIYRSIDKMVEGSIFVAPNTQYVELPKLSNDTEYTFTLKAMDLSGNKSTGVSVTCTPKIIEGNPLIITLTPSTIEKTNKDITVSVKVDNTRKAKTVKYAEGTHDVSYFATIGTEIKDNSFTVKENGTYTVFIQDVDGKREVKTIDVTNIDKTAPGVLKNFIPSYSAANKKIILTWNEPADTDYASVTITTDDVNPQVFNKGTKTYEIPNIEPNDTKTYTFKAVTKDDIGNESIESTVKIIAKNQPIINSIELSRNHLAYNDNDQTITVSIKGSNFDLINSQNVKTVKVGIYDNQGNMQGSLTEATITNEKNSATATITVPKLGYSSKTGTTYTVKAKICGTFADVTKDFIISNPASLSSASLSIKQISSSEVTDTSKVTLTGSGYNLDFLKSLKVGLYDNADQLIDTLVTVDTKDFKNTYTTFTADIPLPQKLEGILTAKVLFDDVVSEYDSYPTVQIYGVPTFTSFTIPKAGTLAEDKPIIATVKGKNFKAPGITETSFTVSCNKNTSITNNANIKVVDDTTLNVTLTIPGIVGDFDVTINSLSNSKNCTFNVRETSSYKIGNIILSDGTNVPYGSYTSESGKTPVAVLCGFNIYGSPLGLGLKRSETQLKWASYHCTGYHVTFDEIVCEPLVYGEGAANTATFRGDTYGSDNWNEICKVDSNASTTATTNYPAFNWVNTYGTTYNLPDGYQDGWYMPSIAELTEIYRNKTEINNAISKLNEGNTRIDNPLIDNWYWSSSQQEHNSASIPILEFGNGNLDTYDKSSTNFVCCVRAF